MKYTQFDPTGRVKTQQRLIDSTTLTTTFQYWFDGNLSQQVGPDGTVVNYGAPDDEGREVAASFPGGGITRSYQLGGGAGLGATVTDVYSGAGPLKSVRTTNARMQLAQAQVTTTGGTDTWQWGYTSSCQAGDNGDVAVETYWDGSANDYCYDDLNRIRAVSGAIPESFALDPYGNITQYTAFNGSAVPYPVTAGNQLSGGGYASDAAGNLTAVPANSNLGSAAHTFSYFATGEVHGVDGTYNYLYDGQDRRFEDSWPTAERHFFYAGTSERMIAMEPYQTGEPWIDYVWLGNDRVAEIYGGSPRYFFTDQVGSTVLVADAGGNAMASWPHKYTAFGMDDPHYVPPTERERFAGKERDPESGMDYSGARHYGAPVGRFLSPDPSLNSGHPADPRSWNHYAYTGDNPLAAIDPTGLFTWSVQCSDDGACLAREQEFLAALAALRKARDAAAAGSKERQSLDAILARIGKEGEDTGVVVAFGTLIRGTPAEEIDGSRWLFWKKSTLVFDTEQIANFAASEAGTSEEIPAQITAEFSGAIAHEGQHAVDFFATGSPQSRAGYLTVERNAYTAQSYVGKGLGLFLWGGLWNPSWSAVDALTIGARTIETDAQRSTAQDCRDNPVCR